MTASAYASLRRIQDDELLRRRKQLEEVRTRAYFEEVAEGRSTLARAKKSATESASRMLGIQGGVGEFHNTGRFEAAVQTDEGPKRLSGHVGCDLQSGPIDRWKSAANDLEEALRRASDNLAPADALAAISRIRDELDRLSELAAARAHLATGTLRTPELAELPKWFEQSLSDLADTEEPDAAPSRAAVDSAELLVRALRARTRDNVEYKGILDVGPLGRLIIDWSVPTGRLQWMVEAVDLPWPTVKVYRLARGCVGSEEPRATKTRILHNAFDATEDLLSHVGNP